VDEAELGERFATHADAKERPVDYLEVFYKQIEDQTAEAPEGLRTVEEATVHPEGGGSSAS
jgi:hypothetical protein